MAFVNLTNSPGNLSLSTNSICSRYANHDNIECFTLGLTHLFFLGNQNKDGYLSQHLRKLKSNHRCQVLGMTGTLMQNDHTELWNLIDLVETGYLGDWEDFKHRTAIPIKIAR